MSLKVENPAAGPGNQTTSLSFRDRLDTSKNQSKLERVLFALVKGWRGHRFDAEHELHDHALHSTVSYIQNQYGVRIDRESVTVPGFQGHLTRVSKYWLPFDQKYKAEKILNQLRKKRERSGGAN